MSEYSYEEYLQNLGQIPVVVGALDFTDPRYKDRQVNFQVRYMLDRTQKMFEYDGLPDTIPQRMLETILQTCGNVCLTEVDGKPYAFFGGLGGMLDEYYQPTIYTIANPYLKYSKNLKIGTECVWGRSDSFGVGLLPIFQWYATMIIETGLTMRVGLINSRISKPISAQDDATYKSALKYLEGIEDGKLGVISDSAFFEGLNIASAQTMTEHLTDVIEAMQYLKASWFNELGLQANYNMKRERIQNAEAENDNDALLPLIDDMLEQRQLMCEQFNEMFGYDVTVKLSSAWEDVQNDSKESENETVADEVEDTSVGDVEQNKSAESAETNEGEDNPGTEEIQNDTEGNESGESEPKEAEGESDITIIINNGDANATIIDDENATVIDEGGEVDETEDESSETEASVG